MRLAIETLKLVALTELIALPLGISAGFIVFRTDAWGRRPLLGLLALAAFVPVPLHATAWLGALGNAGRMQAIGVRPILVGRWGPRALADDSTQLLRDAGATVVATTLAETRTYLGGLAEIPRVPLPEASAVGAA